MVERTAVNRDVVGSSPTRGVFLNIRLRGQAVKTSPFHGGNTGSIPVCVTIHAEVMEQADRADSKSVAARRVGSNPTFSTICS